MNNFVYVILSEAKDLHEDAVFLRDSSPCLRRGQNDMGNCYPNFETSLIEAQKWQTSFHIQTTAIDLGGIVLYDPLTITIDMIALTKRGGSCDGNSTLYYTRLVPAHFFFRRSGG